MATFDILKLSIRGTLPGGEAWSVNPIFDAFNAYEGVEAADMNAVALAVRAVSVPDSLKNLMSSSAQVTSFRVEGRTGGNELILAAEATPVDGSITGLGLATKPYQTSVVASLLTGFAGASRRGRLYWPALGAGINTNLRLNTPTAAKTAADMSAYLRAIQTAISANTKFAGSRLVVFSQKLGVKTPVTDISVGDVLDVQRRRRDRAVESRSSASYPV
jgi:hypothetical protein